MTNRPTTALVADVAKVMRVEFFEHEEDWLDACDEGGRALAELARRAEIADQLLADLHIGTERPPDAVFKAFRKLHGIPEPEAAREGTA